MCNSKFWKWLSENRLILLLPPFLTCLLFKDFLLKGLVPIPADILLGSFHPWTDEVWFGRTSGFPVKNFEIVDVIYQLYPWKLFSIKQIFAGQLPLWNPYNLTGVPHLANIFTSSFYPLNFIFLLLPFLSAWGIYIFLQPFLISLTTYLYLRNLKLSKESSLFGGIVFAFSSIVMMRLEFGMVGHAVLWFPIALLSVDKFFENKHKRWLLIAIFSLASVLLAGYLQIAIYCYLLYGVYCLYRLREKKNLKAGLVLLSVPILAFFLSGVQSIPLINAVINSSRLNNYGNENFFADQFFLPRERLITFLIPDFFGNYATWNFWGKTSYYEFTGYVGIIPIFFVFYSIIKRLKNRSEIFWISVVTISFIFLLKNPISLLPYKLKIPGFSVLIPSRIIFLIDFAFAVLAAFGFDSFQNNKERAKNKVSFLAISLLFFCFTMILITLTKGLIFWPKWQENFQIIIRNFAFPLISLAVLYLVLIFCLGLKNKRLSNTLLIILLLIASLDLIRHALKYNSFVEKETVFTKPKVIDYLLEQKKDDYFRVQILSQNLFPSNTNIVYEIDFLNGYDSFNSNRLKKMLTVANYENVEADLNTFKRSVFLTNHRSPLFDLMNTGYVLSLDEVEHSKLELVFQEGKTKVYKNTKSYPRVYLTREFEVIKNEEEILAEMLRFSREGERKVILEEEVELQKADNDGSSSSARILEYSPQSVKVKTKSSRQEILVFSDAYDSGWRATIDGRETKVYRANYNFRAVLVPEGEHLVDFSYKPKSFVIGLWLSITTAFFLFVIALKIYFKKFIKFKLPLFKKFF